MCQVHMVYDFVFSELASFGRLCIVAPAFSFCSLIRSSYTFCKPNQNSVLLPKKCARRNALSPVMTLWPFRAPTIRLAGTFGQLGCAHAACFELCGEVAGINNMNNGACHVRFLNGIPEFRYLLDRWRRCTSRCPSKSSQPWISCSFLSAYREVPRTSLCSFLYEFTHIREGSDMKLA